MRRGFLRYGITAFVVISFVVSCSTNRVAKSEREDERDEQPTALAKKLARSAKFAPAEESPRTNGDSATAWADQDWLKHSIDGAENSPPPFTAFATARNDWFGLLGRPANGTGKWVPYGPTNGENDLKNVFRDRTVYTTGTENFGGRTTHGVMSPLCKPEPDP